ncbi:general secretion pathway protein [Cupriavidus agavae]|uniref:General secretion pathway protein C n=1 Tax=Cupriavidus agavae TaxID=1001822 RepID=A0A4Q7RC22_9BURK|nr:general secretion pathway protein [Cupriavidus agavae]RZT29668.1 general secretion pathway protein C [Cupriavidus agavae]
MPTLTRPAFRFDLSAAWLPRLAGLALFAALCALVTHWVLAFSAMRTIPVPKTARIAQTEAVETGAVATLFGGSAQAGVRDIQVIGVVADLDGVGPAAAILSIDGGPPKAVRAGALLSSQIKLTEIHGRKVVIERNGVRQEIALPLQNSVSVGRPGNLAATPPAGAAAPLSTPMPAPAQAAPPPAASVPPTPQGFPQNVPPGVQQPMQQVAPQMQGGEGAPN